MFIVLDGPLFFPFGRAELHLSPVYTIVSSARPNGKVLNTIVGAINISTPTV